MSARPAPVAAAETILCDTSFVSVVQSAADNARSARSISVWPEATMTRLNSAILAISVITLAELRDGHIYANWGVPRRARAEQLIATYLLVPLDMAIVDCCADLRATCRRRGVTVPDTKPLRQLPTPRLTPLGDRGGRVRDATPRVPGEVADRVEHTDRCAARSAATVLVAVFWAAAACGSASARSIAATAAFPTRVWSRSTVSGLMFC